MRNSCMQEHALTWIQECMAHALIAATGCLLALSDEVVLQGKVHHTTQDHDSSWVMVSGCTMNLSLGSCCTMKQGPETMELPCRPLSALSMMHTVLVGLKATTQAWWVQICVFSMWVYFNMTLSMTFSMTCKCHVIKTFDCAQKQTHQGLILNANLQRGHPLQDCIKNQGGIINHVSTALLLYDLDWQWWLWQDIVNETMANSIGRTTLAACNLLPSISERIWSSPHLLSPGMASHVNASHWVMSC